MTRSRGGYRGTTDPGSPPAALFRKQIREVDRMTDTPEITRLRSHALNGMVPRDVAIQAVRDTEDRISAEVITDPFAGREDEIRREAVREIVEALREMDGHGFVVDAADLLEEKYLRPEVRDDS